MPFLYLSSASNIHRSNTGFIFCALFGVISNFSNLCHKVDSTCIYSVKNGLHVELSFVLAVLVYSNPTWEGKHLT